MKFDEIKQIIGCAYTYKVSRVVRASLSENRPEHSSHQGDRAFSYYKKIEDISYVAKNGQSLILRNHPNSNIKVNHWYEPELALYLGEKHQIIGYSIANDFTAASIEFEQDQDNYDPTYFAKCWPGSCGLLEAFTNTNDVTDINNLGIYLKIERDGKVIFNSFYNTNLRLREFTELPQHIVNYHNSLGQVLKQSKQILIGNDGFLPAGTVILAGSGLIVPEKFYAQDGDVIKISSSFGSLTNVVKLDNTIREDIEEKNISDFVKQYYFPNFVQGLSDIEESKIEEISDKLAEVIKAGNTIYAFGNGGSDAIAEQFIYALDKKMAYDFSFNSFSNPKLSEATDSCNSELFDHRIKRSGKKGDIVFLISASGDSININRISKLCRQKGITTISISGAGRVTIDQEAKTDTSIVIPVKDQQILEDITQCVLHVVIELVELKLREKPMVILAKEVKKQYINQVVKNLRVINPKMLKKIAEAIIQACKTNHKIRIDAPDCGLLSIVAGHIMHNLKWDALADLDNRPANLIYSGIPSAHLSGVGNDGGDCFNYSIEITDNFQSGDVEILFVKDENSRPSKNLIKAIGFKGSDDLYIFNFAAIDEMVGADLAQMAGHLLGRITNAYLIFNERLRKDLAILRQKDQIRNKFKKEYEQ